MIQCLVFEDNVALIDDQPICEFYATSDNIEFLTDKFAPMIVVPLDGG